MPEILLMVTEACVTNSNVWQYYSLVCRIDSDLSGGSLPLPYAGIITGLGQPWLHMLAPFLDKVCCGMVNV